MLDGSFASGEGRTEKGRSSVFRSSAFRLSPTPPFPSISPLFFDDTDPRRSGGSFTPEDRPAVRRDPVQRRALTPSIVRNRLVSADFVPGRSGYRIASRFEQRVSRPGVRTGRPIAVLSGGRRNQDRRRDSPLFYVGFETASDQRPWPAWSATPRREMRSRLRSRLRPAWAARGVSPGEQRSVRLTIAPATSCRRSASISNCHRSRA